MPPIVPVSYLSSRRAGSGQPSIRLLCLPAGSLPSSSPPPPPPPPPPASLGRAWRGDAEERAPRARDVPVEHTTKGDEETDDDGRRRRAGHIFGLLDGQTHGVGLRDLGAAERPVAVVVVGCRVVRHRVVDQAPIHPTDSLTGEALSQDRASGWTVREGGKGRARETTMDVGEEGRNEVEGEDRIRGGGDKGEHLSLSLGHTNVTNARTHKRNSRGTHKLTRTHTHTVGPQRRCQCARTIQRDEKTKRETKDLDEKRGLGFQLDERVPRILAHDGRMCRGGGGGVEAIDVVNEWAWPVRTSSSSQGSVGARRDGPGRRRSCAQRYVTYWYAEN